MKTRLLFSIICLISSIVCLADNEASPNVYVSPFTVQSGEEGSFVLSFSGFGNDVTGVSCDIVLPEGITVMQDSDGELEIELSDESLLLANHTFSSRKVSDSTYRLLYYSEENKIVPLNDGVFATIKIAAGHNLSGSAQLKLNDIVLSHSDAFNTTRLTSECDFTISEQKYYHLYFIVNGNDTLHTELHPCCDVITPYSAEKRGWTFSGWTGFPSDSIMPKNDVNVTGTLTINTYTLSYYVDNTKYKSYSIDYGAAITPEPEPTKIGYAFSGWSEIPATMPDSDVVITGSFIKDCIVVGTSGTCTWVISNDSVLTVMPTDGVSGTLEDWGKTDSSYAPWNDYRESIVSVKIESEVIAKTCTNMFIECKNVSSINVNGLNTQNVTSMSWMFSGCSSLKSLDLSNFNTQNVTSMGDLFNNCSSLITLDLSSFDTQKVTYMYEMFHGCKALTSLDLSSFNTQNVTIMGYMFSDCKSLITLDLSGFNTQNVKDMYGTFEGCSSLTSLDLSSFNTQNVTSMVNMFYECKSLTSLDLSNFNTQKVTDMKAMFARCSSLTSLDLSNFNTQKETDVYNLFLWCSSLDTIKSINLTPSYLRKGFFSESFENRANCKLYIPKGSVEAYRAADGWNELGKIRIIGEENYKITYMVDGEVYKVDSVEYDEPIIPEPAPESVGYIFSGWSEIPETMPYHDVVVTGSFIVNYYLVTYVLDEEHTFRTDSVAFGAPITLYPYECTDDKYIFAGWDGVPESMPAHDVSVIAKIYLLGDVNGDEEIDVSDISGVVNVALGITEKLHYQAADVTRDSITDVEDIYYLANYIMYGSFTDIPDEGNARRSVIAQNNSCSLLSLAPLSIYSGEETSLIVCLAQGNIASAQFDLVLPEGITVKSDLGGEYITPVTDNAANHSIQWRMQDDGAIRVLNYSANNSAFADSEAGIARIQLVADSDLEAGDYPILFRNVVMITADGRVQRGDFTATISVDNATDINNFANTPSASTPTTIYDLSGRQMNRAVKGINIINGKKVLQRKE